MTTLDQYTLLPDVARRMRSRANMGLWDGRETTTYFESCRWFHLGFQCMMIFTRDTGYHSGGWWKNPMYERCYHLSISFPGGKDKSVLSRVIDGLFGSSKKLLWIEPPYSPEGKSSDVWHYRLFCNELWVPILPKGEVYSTQFTERGWKSFSELKSVKNRI